MTETQEDRRALEKGPLVVASHNAGKIREINALLAPFGFTVTSSADHDVEEPVEDGLTFEANAKIKALATASATGQMALADDSGLVVEGLDGAPGIYSARWAGPEKDFGLAMQRVHDELSAKGCTSPETRKAYFIACLCLAWPDGHTQFYTGRVDGTIVWPPRGTQGFGYDPVFQPDGHDRTFGEMTPEEKHGADGRETALSHRSRAFALLRDAVLRNK